MAVSIPLLTVIRGDRFPFNLTLWADAAQTVPYPIDTADELVAEIRMDTGTPVLATFEITVLSENSLQLVLPAEVTDEMVYDGPKLSWDLQATWGTAAPLDVRTLVQGQIEVVGDISESTGAVHGLVAGQQAGSSASVRRWSHAL